MQETLAGRNQLSDPAGCHFTPIVNLLSGIESIDEHDFACPGCDTILLRRVSTQAVHGITFRCPTRGTYCRTPENE